MSVVKCSGTAMTMALYRSSSAMKLMEILFSIGCRIRKHMPKSRNTRMIRYAMSDIFFFRR